MKILSLCDIFKKIEFSDDSEITCFSSLDFGNSGVETLVFPSNLSEIII